MTTGVLVLLDALVWLGVSILVGGCAGLVPQRWLTVDTWLTRIRRWEHDGDRYRSLAIGRWKDRLPETNRFGPGERPSKRRLIGRSGLEPLVIETRRAEYVHWAIAAFGPLFWIWNPRWLGFVMVGFGIVMNAPFITVQRYNRARALAILDRSPRGVVA